MRFGKDVVEVVLEYNVVLEFLYIFFGKSKQNKTKKETGDFYIVFGGVNASHVNVIFFFCFFFSLDSKLQKKANNFFRKMI